MMRFFGIQIGLFQRKLQYPSLKPKTVIKHGMKYIGIPVIPPLHLLSHHSPLFRGGKSRAFKGVGLS
jgi:hypothetical protein